jgi:hypothetical protein
MGNSSSNSLLCSTIFSLNQNLQRCFWAMKRSGKSLKVRKIILSELLNETRRGNRQAHWIIAIFFLNGYRIRRNLLESKSFD